MSYQDAIDQDCRLVILRALAESHDYRHNDSVLADIAERYGIRSSRDYIKGQIRWLENVGAVTVSQIGEVLIATATQLGIDHAERRIVLDGIKRPSPKR